MTLPLSWYKMVSRARLTKKVSAKFQLSMATYTPRSFNLIATRRLLGSKQFPAVPLSKPRLEGCLTTTRDSWVLFEPTVSFRASWVMNLKTWLWIVEWEAIMEGPKTLTISSSKELTLSLAQLRSSRELLPTQGSVTHVEALRRTLSIWINECSRWVRQWAVRDRWETQPSKSTLKMSSQWLAWKKT